MEEFNAKKLKLMVKILMPILAIIIVLVFIFVPVKILNLAEQKEAEEKNEQIEKKIDFDIFDWI